MLRKWKVSGEIELGGNRIKSGFSVAMIDSLDSTNFDYNELVKTVNKVSGIVYKKLESGEFKYNGYEDFEEIGDIFWAEMNLNIERYMESLGFLNGEYIISVSFKVHTIDNEEISYKYEGIP